MMKKNSSHAADKDKTAGECVDVGGLLDFLRLTYTDIQRLLADAQRHPGDPNRFPLPVHLEGRNYWSLAAIKRYMKNPKGLTKILRKEKHESDGIT